MVMVVMVVVQVVAQGGGGGGPVRLCLREGKKNDKTPAKRRPKHLGSTHSLVLRRCDEGGGGSEGGRVDVEAALAAVEQLVRVLCRDAAG